MAKLLLTDGTIKDIEPKNGTDFKLEELYDLLGVDMIEIVNINRNLIMVVDEEALRKDVLLPLNEEASYYYGGPIYGNALLCNNNQVR